MNDVTGLCSRRGFMTAGAAAGTGLCLGGGTDTGDTAHAAEAPGYKPVEARHWDSMSGTLAQCRVCPRECVIRPGERGFCNTRENREGTLYSLVYGAVAAVNVDPVEKKPFYHLAPGSPIYSLATAGCNLTCAFCQNHTLSQSRPEDLRSRSMTPGDVVDATVAADARLIAATYNEPTVFTEFVCDIAAAGRMRNVHTAVVSNGYINEEPLERLAEVITAYKVDLKAFTDSFYREVTGGELKPVLETIRRLKRLGVWTEIVHLTIPTLNDREGDFRDMGDWLAGEIGPDIPVHVTRFHPTYRLTTLPVTPVSTLEMARDTLMDRGLRYVYVGNVPGHPGNATYCPGCGRTVVERMGFTVRSASIKDGRCAFCDEEIAGAWTLD
jgi:pyruvate formate lyase activating enzyme